VLTDHVHPLTLILPTTFYAMLKNYPCHVTCRLLLSFASHQIVSLRESTNTAIKSSVHADIRATERRFCTETDRQTDRPANALLLYSQASCQLIAIADQAFIRCVSYEKPTEGTWQPKLCMNLSAPPSIAD